MKKIGLVGGTGPESTLMYYKELNSRIDKMTGGTQMPDLAIESVNFRRAWDYVCNKEYSANKNKPLNQQCRKNLKIIILTSQTQT